MHAKVLIHVLHPFEMWDFCWMGVFLLNFKLQLLIIMCLVFIIRRVAPVKWEIEEDVFHTFYLNFNQIDCIISLESLPHIFGNVSCFLDYRYWNLYHQLHFCYVYWSWNCFCYLLVLNVNTNVVVAYFRLLHAAGNVEEKCQFLIGRSVNTSCFLINFLIFIFKNQRSLIKT